MFQRHKTIFINAQLYHNIIPVTCFGMITPSSGVRSTDY